MSFLKDIGDRAMVGKVILLEDKKRGGVKAKAFLNYTFGKCFMNVVVIVVVCFYYSDM